jgi:hypothetical protein
LFVEKMLDSNVTIGMSLTGALTPAGMREIQEELRAWSKGMGHTRILMSTKRTRFRAWARLFQFTAWRIIMSDEGFHADD